jgi:succinate dehydrogenase/fumarate reductase cytochrome b subunit
MFVWIFHRLSGLLLILLLGLKPDWALVLHTNPLSDTLIIVLIVFHAFYGLRTVIIDLGLQKEKLLFWIFTLLSLAMSAFLLVVYFTRNY